MDAEAGMRCVHTPKQYTYSVDVKLQETGEQRD